VIARLLEEVRPRAGAADAAFTTDETISAIVGPGTAEVSRSETVGCHLRVQHGGRIGMAGGTDPDLEALIAAALMSAEQGESGSILLPAPSPLPEVVTAVPAARSLGPSDGVGLARLLRERLERDGREVVAWAERSAGRVDVGNTRDVLAGYDVTLVGVGARIRMRSASGTLHLRVHHASTGVPSSVDVERLVDEVERRLTPPALDGPTSTPVPRVGFAPRAVIALLAPLRQMLLGSSLFEGRAPLAGRFGERTLSPMLTILDDPLANNRPGSRPIDDEGVVCRRLTLIDQGVVRGWLADLASGLRLGVPPTGHGVRAPGAPPRTGWSNFVVGPGEADAGDLASLVGEGMIVLDLPLPSGNLVDGRVVLTTPWAYRVEQGAVVGRVERLTVRGNLLEMLNRIVAVGRAVDWVGAAAAPAMVIEEVEAGQ
jgi:predicted Zn-dependent protease